MTERGPLAGKRIVNTRAPHQQADFDALLCAQGAEPIAYPCIDIAPPEDTSALDEAIRTAAAGGFDWLVLTSRNTVLMLARRLEALGLPAHALNGLRVATVGPATAEAAEAQLSLTVDLTPDEYVAEALATTLVDAPGGRIFLPQSAIARPTLHGELTDAGLDVTCVAAYRTIPGSGGADIPALLKAGQVHAVTFTSSSTARNFVRRLQNEGGSLSDLDGVCVACIGPITGETASDLGLAVSVIPEDYTLEGMVQALAAYFADR